MTGQPRGGSSSALGVALVVMGGLLALWALAQSQSGGSVSSPSQRLKLQDLRRQQKQKAVSQALAAAPKPPPGPKQQNEIERSARELGVDQARFESLARDPARGWTVDDNSIEEARIAVRLERSGRLHDVVRSPYPRSDLVEDEGAGQEWCVKSPWWSNFDVNVTILNIRNELTTGNNIIVNTAHLNAVQASELRQAVDVLGWSDRVLFASSE